MGHSSTKMEALKTNSENSTTVQERTDEEWGHSGV